MAAAVGIPRPPRDAAVRNRVLGANAARSPAFMMVGHPDGAERPILPGRLTNASREHRSDRRAVGSAEARRQWTAGGAPRQHHARQRPAAFAKSGPRRRVHAAAVLRAVVNRSEPTARFPGRQRSTRPPSRSGVRGREGLHVGRPRSPPVVRAVTLNPHLCRKGIRPPPSTCPAASSARARRPQPRRPFVGSATRRTTLGCRPVLARSRERLPRKGAVIQGGWCRRRFHDCRSSPAADGRHPLRFLRLDAVVPPRRREPSKPGVVG